MFGTASPITQPFPLSRSSRTRIFLYLFHSKQSQNLQRRSQTPSQSIEATIHPSPNYLRRIRNLEIRKLSLAMR